MRKMKQWHKKNNSKNNAILFNRYWKTYGIPSIKNFWFIWLYICNRASIRIWEIIGTRKKKRRNEKSTQILKSRNKKSFSCIENHWQENSISNIWIFFGIINLFKINIDGYKINMRISIWLVDW